MVENLWTSFDEPIGEGMLVLEIGARDRPQAPFIWPKAHIEFLDIDPQWKPDYVADAAKMPEELVGKCDAILASHVLEHFPYHDIPDVLYGWGKCLKEGGRLIVFVPALEWAAGQILSGKNIDAILGHLFAGQINPHDFHKTGFTMKSLMTNLRMAGFEIVIAGKSDYGLKIKRKLYRAKQHCVKSVWKSNTQKENAQVT